MFWNTTTDMITYGMTRYFVAWHNVEINEYLLHLLEAYRPEKNKLSNVWNHFSELGVGAIFEIT